MKKIILIILMSCVSMLKGTVIDLDSEKLEAMKKDTSLPYAVFVYPSWYPARRLTGAFDSFAESYKNKYHCALINSDEHRELIQDWNIGCMLPAFVVIKDGEKIGECPGSIGGLELADEIEKMLHPIDLSRVSNDDLIKQLSYAIKLADVETYERIIKSKVLYDFEISLLLNNIDINIGADSIIRMADIARKAGFMLSTPEIRMASLDAEPVMVTEDTYVRLERINSYLETINDNEESEPFAEEQRTHNNDEHSDFDLWADLNDSLFYGDLLECQEIIKSGALDKKTMVDCFREYLEEFRDPAELLNDDTDIDAILGFLKIADELGILSPFINQKDEYGISRKESYKMLQKQLESTLNEQKKISAYFETLNVQEKR